jgi:hypothetical protein
MPAPAAHQRLTHHAPRGGVYLAVLGTVTVVTLIGLTALTVHRASLERAELAHDTSRAHALARSAVEIGLSRIHAEPDWRTDFTSTAWFTNRVPGSARFGRFDLSVVDPIDNDYTDNVTDPVLLIGTARVGAAQRRLAVTLYPVERGYESLNVSLAASGNISFGTLSGIGTDGTFWAAGNISASAAAINTRATASGNITGATYFDGTDSSEPALKMPSMGDALSAYTDLATEIRLDDLERSGSDYFLRNVALGPGYNPFRPSETNPLGIYSIDAGGKDITVSNCRIVGTLIILNPKDTSDIGNRVAITPVLPNYPALIVKGAVRLGNASFSASLSESSKSINFNPAGVPNDSGDTDSDTSDSYAAKICGVVLVDGDVTVTPGILTIDGTVQIAGNVAFQTSASFNILHNPAAYNDAPPALGDGSITTYTLSDDWSRVAP